MFRLNRNVEYALMALKVMTQKTPGELTSAKDVVDQVGCPFDATARVLQKMARRKVLKSEHGAQGGYVLIRDLSRLSLFELVEIVLGPVNFTKCLSGEGGCDLEHKCNIQSPVTVLNRRLTDFYREISVAELLRLGVREERYDRAQV